MLSKVYASHVFGGPSASAGVTSHSVAGDWYDILFLYPGMVDGTVSLLYGAGRLCLISQFHFRSLLVCPLHDSGRT